MKILKSRIRQGSLFSVLFIILSMGTLLVTGCSSSSSNDTAGGGGEQPIDQKMIFSATSLTYYSDDQENELTIFKERFAICVGEENMDQLREFLQNELIVKQPLDIDELPGEIILVELNEEVTDEQILELIGRLNQLDLTKYSTPMFTAPSTRAILTHELIVKFKDIYSTEEIEGLIESKKVQILKKDYLWSKCYILGFTAQSGSNTLDVSRTFHESAMVEYAHPNFMELIEPPGNGIHVIGQDKYEIVQGGEQRYIFYPNLFLEFDNIFTAQPMEISGWEVICEEDFEGPNPFDGWVNEDRDPNSGQYYWGAVNDAEYPSMPWESYEPEGNKGWPARFHNVGYPDRWPNMDSSSEGYAKNMDTWFVYGPFDLSNAFWARLWFKGAFYAPSTETFGWVASIDGENWFGTNVTGVGEDKDYYYWWPRYWMDDPPNRGMCLDLSKVPELGDLTGQEEVYVAFYYQSDGTTTPLDETDDFSFYGIFLDDILIEQCKGINVPLITSDPLSNRQWALRNRGQSGGEEGIDINVMDAWSFLENAQGVPAIDDEEEGVIVAVLDEGVDLNHEDLDLVPGYDATYDPEDPNLQDSHGGANPWDAHGTCCAGIIGAIKNNVGIVGVAPGVKIMPIRIAYSPEGETYWVTTKAQQADGILWAAQHGAKVLSNSWGGMFSGDIVSDAIRDVRDMGSTVVFASGNDNNDYPTFPAYLEDVVAVGALSPCGERKSPDSCDGEWWWGSNYGEELDIMAPGVLNPTTDIMGDGGYAIANDTLGISGNYLTSFNGTSSACPYVAGVIALMLTVNPDLAPDMVQGIIQSTAVDLSDAGFDEETGYGLIHAYEAVYRAAELHLDLYVSQYTLPDNAYIDQLFDVDITVGNDGLVPVGYFYIQVYLSADEEIDASDTLLWSGTTSGTIEASGQEHVTQSILVPSDIPPGFYNLIIWIDGHEMVYERDETNNIIVYPIEVDYVPNLVVKPQSVDFGTVPVGLGKNKNVQIKNEGEGNLGTLVITDVTFSGDTIFNNTEFNIVPTTPFELEKNEYVQMALYFVPDIPGTYSGAITITSNDPDEPEKQISLSGVAVEGEPSGWSKTYGHGDTYYEEASRSIHKTEDGGYIFTAVNSKDGYGSDDFWVVKLHEDGAIQWQKGFGGASIDAPKWVQQTSGGGYIVTGYSYSYRTGSQYCDVWVLKLNSSGTIEWQKTYGGTGYDIPNELRETFDNQGNSTGYVLVGWTTSFGAWGYDIWVLHLSSAGAITWEKTYGGTDDEFGRSIQQVFDQEGNPDGYVVAADTESFGAGERDAWVLKLDTSGTVEWEKTYGGLRLDLPVSIQLADGGGYVVGSRTTSFGAGGDSAGDFWVLKLGANGDMLWQYTYGGAEDEHAEDLRKTADGGYVMTGWTYSFDAVSNDAWVVKLNGTGTIEWQKIYNKPYADPDDASDWAHSITQSEDGGYLVLGETDFWDENRNGDIWVFKVNSFGELGCDIGLDTTAVPNGTAEVSVSTETNEYSVSDSSAIVGTPGSDGYDTDAEVITQCGAVVAMDF